MGIRHWQQLSLTHFLCVEDKKQNKKRIRQVRNLNTESNSWEFQQHINKSSTGGGIFLLLCAFKHCELKEVNRRCGAICLLLLRSKVVTREKKIRQCLNAQHRPPDCCFIFVRSVTLSQSVRHRIDQVVTCLFYSAS